MSRVEWSGGWAELNPRLTHGRRMRIIRVLDFGASESTPAEKYQFQAELIAAHVVAWSLGDVDPVAGPSVETLDGLPMDAFDSLATSAIAAWTGRADPNASAASSGDGLTAAP